MLFTEPTELTPGSTDNDATAFLATGLPAASGQLGGSLPTAPSLPSGLQLLGQTPLSRTSQPEKERQLLKIFITTPEEQADLLLQLPAKYLDDAVCQRVYSACHELADTGRTVNMHSVVDQIRSQFPPQEQEALLAGYTRLLLEPVLDEVENLLIEVGQAYRCRVFFKLMQDGNRAFIRNEPITDLYDQATKTLLEAEAETSRREPLARIVERTYQEILFPPEQSVGLATGLDEFDKVYGGVIPDRMLVYGGLTGAGKTSAAIDITDRLLSRHPDRLAILWISLEMNEERLMRKLYSRRSLITNDRMRDHAKPGFTPLTAGERARLHDAHAVLKQWPNKCLEIHYGTTSAAQIRQLGRRFCLKHQGKQTLIIIDHLGMVEHSGRGNDNIRAEFINSMKAIKSLQMDFNATTMPLVQLVKAVKSQQRQDTFYRPHTGDIAESGFIEQTADTLTLWWRPEAYCGDLGRTTLHYGNNPDWNPQGRTIGIVGKNRDGQSGIDIVFESEVKYSMLQNNTKLDYYL